MLSIKLISSMQHGEIMRRVKSAPKASDNQTLAEPNPNAFFSSTTNKDDDEDKYQKPKKETNYFNLNGLFDINLAETMNKVTDWYASIPLPTVFSHDKRA